jgi:hypothetical protein
VQSIGYMFLYVKTVSVISEYIFISKKSKWF